MLNFLISSRICFVFILAILFIIPGCGGGGGGDDGGGGGTPAPTVPTVINYAVGAPSPSVSPLKGTAANGMQFTITQMQLAGSYDRSSYATSLQDNKGMAFTLNASPAALGGGAMTIGLLTPSGSTGKWVSGSNPTEGKFQVNVSVGYTIGTIMVEVNSGGTGVNIYLDGALKQSNVPWNLFTDTMSLTDDYEIIASLAYNVLQAVYRCVSITYTMVDIVMRNQDTLSQSMINTSKTGYYGLTANMSAQWEDQHTNGEIDPGDGFMSRFSGWWVDNSGTSQDYVYNGRVVWTNYIETTNSVGGDFKIGISGDALYEDEMNSGVPDFNTRITYQDSGYLFILSW